MVDTSVTALDLQEENDSLRRLFIATLDMIRPHFDGSHWILANTYDLLANGDPIRQNSRTVTT